METNAIYELSICVDCYFYDKYGLESFTDGIVKSLDDDQRQAIIDGFDKLGTGLMSDRHDDSKVYFSWSPCDICDSHLGGDRWDVVWTTFKTPQAVTLN
jgi:hypothetical protein